MTKEKMEKASELESEILNLEATIDTIEVEGYRTVVIELSRSSQLNISNADIRDKAADFILKLSKERLVEAKQEFEDL